MDFDMADAAPGHNHDYMDLDPAVATFSGGGDDDGDRYYDDASEISDSDSDALEVRADCARFDMQREAFVAQQRADTTTTTTTTTANNPSVSVSAQKLLAQPPSAPSGSGSATGTGPGSGPGSGSGSGKPLGARLAARKIRRLGPRKAAKPTPDILFRLSLAKAAFERKEYPAAVNMLGEIIRINSETYNAWTLLSTIHEELGDREKATMCLMTAAHLVPKNVPYWISTALYALHGIEDMDDGPEKDTALQRAIFCYSRVLGTDRSNIEARTGKADALMMQGHAYMALVQYQRALEYRPLNIRTVRNIADVALDAKDPRKSCEIAKKAYRHVIDHLQATGTFDAEEGRFEWSDLRIYLEFFTILEQWQQGAQELKEISRWLLGRRFEKYWNEWATDDREWDLHDDRRIEVPKFEPARFPQDSYGQGLPKDLRAKLFVYRRKLGHEYEALMHLRLLEPAGETAVDDFIDFPDCLKEIGTSLLEACDKANEALLYFNLYRRIAASSGGDIAVDADVLVGQGRCHMALGDKAAAEECFIAAMEEDEDNIEARVQLANMYEGEQEQEGREEAFLLVREAMNLEARQGGDGAPSKPRRRRGPLTRPRKPRAKREKKPRDPNAPKKSKYVPRRLINAEKRKQQDLEMTKEAAKNLQALQELKGRVVAGDELATTVWMKAAKDLVDDFRSYKRFYPWEKYIKYLGYGANVPGGQSAVPSRNMKLAAMAERLQQNLAPAEGGGGQGQQQEEDAAAAGAAAAAAAAAAAGQLAIKIPQEHRGIAFDKWLDIFLDYAFSLVRAGQHREAYVVCHAARDSVVWMSTENTFLIHVAWASCAVYAGDEETCVAIARYFMRDYMPGTDSYRMFTAMCRVCQTPVSWYTSGPAQKFILRQIKTMDNIIVKSKEQQQQQPPEEAGTGTGASGSSSDIGLDVCLLTIYGHILFSTTSYTYALSYFARAASLDPHNCLINLSIGLAYAHYALKRQATNRQYLLTQGFAFLFRYYDDRLRGGNNISKGQRMEAHFNMARAYSLVGLSNLALEYYKKVLDVADEEDPEGEEEEEGKAVGNEDLTFEAAYNVRTICFLLGDLLGAKAVTDRYMRLGG